MNAIETWIVAHQVLLLTLWPIITAAASLGYKLLDETSRGHAFLSTLAALGVDIPKIIDAVGRMINPPSAPPANPSDGSNDEPTQKMKPPTSQRQRLVFVSLLTLGLASITVGGFAAAITGCKGSLNPPPNTPADVTGAIDCVTTALITSGDLGQCILTYGPALIADAIQTLLHSQFAKDHPELLPLMKDRLFTVRRQVDAGSTL